MFQNLPKIYKRINTEYKKQRDCRKSKRNSLKKRVEQEQKYISVEKTVRTEKFFALFASYKVHETIQSVFLELPDMDYGEIIKDSGLKPQECKYYIRQGNGHIRKKQIHVSHLGAHLMCSNAGHVYRLL